MLNPSIILGAQQGNTVNALAQANQAAQMQNDIQRQREINALLMAQGDKIASGDQNALNALARFDPNAALGIQGTRQDQAQSAGRFEMDQGRFGMQQQAHALDMRAGEQRMAMLGREEQRAIEAHAASLSAAEAEAQRRDIEQDVAVLGAAQTPEQWDMAARQTGNEELVGGFEAREMVFAQVLGLKEVLDRQAPAEDNTPAGIRALDIRAERAGLAEGTPEYQQFMLSGGKVPESETVFGPDGKPILQRGSGAMGGNGKDLTVDAAKNTGFLIRAQDSMRVLDALEGEGTDLGAKIANNIPVLGNYLQTPEYRQYDQARRDFINAVLRRESGAVIADSEFANAERQYFPQPGDDPATIAQKRQNRENAVRGFEVGAGDGVNRIAAPQQSAAQPAQNRSIEAEAIQDFGLMTAEEILGADIPSSAEDLAAWNKRMDELGL
ncbi:MAG: hypothetical protein AAGJ85_00755 [Pseudomonadota bacterium]